jgi:arginase family enzyme
MSRLRAKCPDCRTYTAVALGPDYQCHACGRAFGAGLVRVPRAWGKGGDAMAQAALLPLPYPETAVIEEDSLELQSLVLASDLPERPLVLGGCCCAHVGAVEGLAARYGRISVVWFDAHGDLNTPETSPSGNPWGMPLRMLFESGAASPEDAVLIGARNLDPAEADFITASGLHMGPEGVETAVAETEGAYVALDCDALAAEDVSSFMPEPHGIPLAEAEFLLAAIRSRAPILGAGVSGLRPDRANVEPVSRLCAALGL